MGKTNQDTMSKYKSGLAQGLRLAKGQSNKLGPTAADKGDLPKTKVGWVNKGSQK